MAALTRRERKVKDILLKELNRMHARSGMGGLSYSEKQHLQKGLNVEFIDRELENMLKQRQWLGKLKRFGLFMAAAVVIAGLVSLFLGYEFSGFMHVYLPLYCVLAALTTMISLRSLQRKQFIYEALRELSDADELDVTLDRITQQADALIQKIVDRELEAEARYPAQKSGLRELA